MISGFHLWFTLIGLYLLESIRIAAPGTVVFRRRFLTTTWSWRRRFANGEAGRSVWMLASLIPGTDPDIIAQDFILACDSERITPNALFVSSDQRAVCYGDIRSVGTDERYLLIDGKRYLHFQTSGAVQSAKRHIDRLISMAENKREAAIVESVDLAFALDVCERLRTFRVETRAVRILSSLLWIVAFFVLPGVLFIVGNDVVLLPLGALIWLLAVAISIVTILAKKRITPAGRREFPWTTLKYLFYPVAALRACESLAEDVFTDVHPAMICMDLCRGDHQNDCLTYLLLRILHPVSLSRAGDAKADAVSAKFNSLFADRLRKELAKTVPQVLKSLVPQRQHETSVSYCPRCRAQYQITEGECADCPGVALQQFAHPVGRDKAS
jgi:hypothetical protein